MVDSILKIISDAQALEGNQNKKKLPYEQFLQQIEFSRAFLPPVSHGGKKGREILISCRNCSQGSCSYFDLPLRISLDKALL